MDNLAFVQQLSGWRRVPLSSGGSAVVSNASNLGVRGRAPVARRGGGVVEDAIADAAEAATQELESDIMRLRIRCALSFDEGCESVVFHATQHCEDRAPRMIDSIRAGDREAGDKLLQATRNIRAAVIQEAERIGAETSPGAMLSRFTQEVVVQTAQDTAAAGKSAARDLTPLLFAIAAVFAAKTAYDVFAK